MGQCGGQGDAVVVTIDAVDIVVETLEQERVRLDLVELEQGGLVGQALRVPADLDLAVEDLGLGQRDRVAGGELPGAGGGAASARSSAGSAVSQRVIWRARFATAWTSA